MSNTTNYGWNIPDNTDLVKDGALAIRTLGSAIDTSMNTALGTRKAGMVLLNTTSFSGVASVTLPTNTFSSTYTNYKIIVTITASTDQNGIFVRMTNSGTPVTTTSYDRNNVFLNPTTAATLTNENSNDNQTSILIGGFTTAGGVLAFDVFNPFETKITQITALNFTTTNGLYISGGRVETSTSYDALLVGATNITGSISAYAYNK
jgi:hypothetical protein